MSTIAESSILSNPEKVLLWSSKSAQATRLAAIVLVVAETDRLKYADSAAWTWYSVRDIRAQKSAELFMQNREISPMNEGTKNLVRDNIQIFTPWMKFCGKWVRLNLVATHAVHVLMTRSSKFDIICDLEGRTRLTFQGEGKSRSHFVDACLAANSGFPATSGFNILGPYSHDNFTTERYETWSVLLNAQYIETINCLKEDVVVPGSIFRMNIWMKNGRQLDGVLVSYSGDRDSITPAQLIRHMMTDTPATKKSGNDKDDALVQRWESRRVRRLCNAARAKPY